MSQKTLQNRATDVWAELESFFDLVVHDESRWRARVVQRAAQFDAGQPARWLRGRSVSEAGWNPRVRAAVRAIGPGSGARWLPRRRWVLVFWRNPRARGMRECGDRPPIPCPEVPPLGPGAYPEAVQYIDGLVQATRALPAHAPIGSPSSDTHAAAAKLAIRPGDRQRAGRHSSFRRPCGYRPVTRAAEFNTPILILHGTADGPAGGGSANTHVALARDFEAALRRNQKPVERITRRRWPQHLFHQPDSARR